MEVNQYNRHPDYFLFFKKKNKKKNQVVSHLPMSAFFNGGRRNEILSSCVLRVVRWKNTICAELKEFVIE